MEKTPDNIVALHEDRPSYEFVYLRTRYRLSFDERYLYENVEGWSGRTQNVHLLHRLSPKFREEHTGSQNAIDQVRKGWLFMLGAIVVFFSDFNSQIPLLAPSLVGLALLLFIYNMPKAWPRNWVKVCDDWDYMVSAIPYKEDPDQGKTNSRVEFLRKLSEAIEDAKKKELYAG